jgi:hypothetical protein
MKYKFIKTKDADSRYDISNITMEVDTTDLIKLIEEFELFLRACSFGFDGHLEIVKDEE